MLVRSNSNVKLGYFLPRELIESFPKGAINIHPSLLPKYRGPAPIQHTLLNGDTEAGVSIIEVDPTKFDSGDILMQERIRIDGSDGKENEKAKPITFTPLADKLSDIGAQMVIKVIENLDLYRQQKVKQGNEGVCKAPKVKTEDKFINDWTSSMKNMNKFRAFESLHCRMQPGNLNLTFMDLRFPTERERTILSNVKAAPKSCLLMKDRKGLAVRFDDDWLIITRLKLEGKKEVSALEFFNGYLLRRDKDEAGVITDALS